MEEFQFPWGVVVFLLVFVICFASLRWGIRKYLLDPDLRVFPMPLWFDFILVLLVFIPLLWLNL